MSSNDILATVKEAVSVELNRQANEQIEKLVQEFRCELGKHKADVIAGLVNSIDIATQDNPLGVPTIQIVIRRQGSVIK
jgi:hypothetical protein